MTQINTNTYFNLLRSDLSRLQTDAADLTNQISSGKKTDRFGGMRTNEARNVISMRTEMQRLETYQKTIDTLETRAGRVELAINSTTGFAETVKDMVYGIPTNATTEKQIVFEAKNALDSIESVLNTTVNGSYIFSGENALTPPVNLEIMREGKGVDGDADYIPSLEVFLESGRDGDNYPGPTDNAPTDQITTPETLHAAVQEWFELFEADPEGGPGWYQGGDLPEGPAIADNQRTGPPGTANDPGFRKIMANLAGLAYGGGPPQPGVSSKNDYQTFAETSSLSIGKAAGVTYSGSDEERSLRDLLAENGLFRKTLETQNNRHENTKSFASSVLRDIESVDPADAITKLQELQFQLQASYSLTGQLRQLSLVNYI
jgi:flagellar hook-associated protein 3 FlgL